MSDDAIRTRTRSQPLYFEPPWPLFPDSDPLPLIPVPKPWMSDPVPWMSDSVPWMSDSVPWMSDSVPLLAFPRCCAWSWRGLQLRQTWKTG